MNRRWWLFLLGLFLCLLIWQVMKDRAVVVAPASSPETMQITEPEIQFISELDFAKRVIEIALAKGWSGLSGGPLPVSLEDFSSEQISRYVVAEQARIMGITIPEALASLYTTPSAQDSMKQLLRQFRGEYLDYLDQKGVAQRYLDEINSRTLPDDSTRLFYYPTPHYPGTKSTNTHTYERSEWGDFSQLQIDVHAANVYKVALEFERSGVLGTTADTGLSYRDMAMRYVVYHEMTHVLQRAVDVVNAPAEDKKKSMPWLHSQRSIIKVDTTYYQQWGSQTDLLTRHINNLTLAQERQAEGISIEIVKGYYQLSPSQRQQLWNYHFGILRQGTEAINLFFQLLETHYPEENGEAIAHRIRVDFVEKIPQVELKSVFSRMQDRLDGYMAAHLGYLNPMLPQDTHRFWDYLAK